MFKYNPNFDMRSCTDILHNEAEAVVRDNSQHWTLPKECLEIILGNAMDGFVRLDELNHIEYNITYKNYYSIVIGPAMWAGTTTPIYGEWEARVHKDGEGFYDVEFKSASRMAKWLNAISLLDCCYTVEDILYDEESDSYYIREY